MAISFSGAFHHSTTPQVLTVLFVVAALVLPDHVQGRLLGNGCPPFSCGHLRNVASPFRRRGDPPGCGVQSYELLCGESKATIRIGDAIYYVKHINQSEGTFWVVDANLDNSSCPLPRWSRLPWYELPRPSGLSRHWIEVELAPDTDWWATFVRCSQEIKSNGMYRPVACLSTSYAFVYVLSGPASYYVENLEPSCGYLAMTPLGGWGTMLPRNASLLSYANTVKFMRNGFAVGFPFTVLDYHDWTRSIKSCLAERFDSFPESGIKDRIVDILVIDYILLVCVGEELERRSPGFERVRAEYQITVPALWFVKWIAVLCRFVLMPLAILIFLAHKYWRTRVTIDAVEKFLRMHDRPTMSEVIEMLEGGADDGLQVPPKPFFCEDEQFPAAHSYHFSSKLTVISEEDE